ncbi:MAG: hypothetical protein AAF938_09710 [Myxococcota bacterium]
MNRTQRKAHARIWWVLAPLLLASLGWAVSTRPAPAPAAEAAP